MNALYSNVKRKAVNGIVQVFVYSWTKSKRLCRGWVVFRAVSGGQRNFVNLDLHLNYLASDENSFISHYISPASTVTFGLNSIPGHSDDRRRRSAPKFGFTKELGSCLALIAKPKGLLGEVNCSQTRLFNIWGHNFLRESELCSDNYGCRWWDHGQGYEKRSISAECGLLLVEVALKL